MLPDIPIRRAAATIDEVGIWNSAGERALLLGSRERRKCQPALLSALLPLSRSQLGSRTLVPGSGRNLAIRRCGV